MILRNFLAKLGKMSSSKKIPLKKTSQIPELRKSGLKVKEIAKKLNISSKTVTRYTDPKDKKPYYKQKGYKKPILPFTTRYIATHKRILVKRYGKKTQLKTNFRFGYIKRTPPYTQINGVFAEKGVYNLQECFLKSGLKRWWFMMNREWEGGWTYTIYQKGSYYKPLYQISG